MSFSIYYSNVSTRRCNNRILQKIINAKKLCGFAKRSNVCHFIVPNVSFIFLIEIKAACL